MCGWYFQMERSKIAAKVEGLGGKKKGITCMLVSSFFQVCNTDEGEDIIQQTQGFLDQQCMPSSSPLRIDMHRSEYRIKISGF